MTTPKRLDKRRTHLDAAAVPVERALLARAGAISASVMEVFSAAGDTETAETLAAHIRLDLAQEFRALPKNCTGIERSRPNGSRLPVRR